MLSHRYYPIERELDRVLRKYASTLDSAFSVELARPMMETRLEYLNRALDTIDAEFGGAENYLDQALGFDAAKRTTVRERLTVPIEQA